MLFCFFLLEFFVPNFFLLPLSFFLPPCAALAGFFGSQCSRSTDPFLSHLSVARSLFFQLGTKEQCLGNEFSRDQSLDLKGWQRSEVDRWKKRLNFEEKFQIFSKGSSKMFLKNRFLDSRSILQRDEKKEEEEAKLFVGRFVYRALPYSGCTRWILRWLLVWSVVVKSRGCLVDVSHSRGGVGTLALSLSFSRPLYSYTNIYEHLRVL